MSGADNIVTLYRSMGSAEDGFPLTGAIARTLGARPAIDIVVDSVGMVRPGTGGVSVAPNDIMHLPVFRRPPEFGGTGKDPVWSIRAIDLGPDLRYRPDPDNPAGHGFIEPARRMRFSEYQDALHATSGTWRPATFEGK